MNTRLDARGPARTSRRVALAAAALLLVLAASCIPLNQNERTGMVLLNNYRTSQGLPQLAYNDGLQGKARYWANKLAADGRLSHSNLASGVPGGWTALGENVAAAASAEAATNALVASPTHRANIVSRKFTHMGVGSATGRDGRVYLVQVFARF